ncbi:hypothetical protein EDD18DRAFT_1118729 [Armillaria luteobubalina]|uniref:Uncharacterized protein n=1 Tax=Armillaria luteobubalina TaxID=153913 RepID=A0AA39NUT2_9AGAR|nr:hypothetical protein EDD18DRAFT_1118729 [Armillaria luteobubalina]
MIRLKKFRKFNKTFPLDGPPEEVTEKRYARNNSLKTHLYNMVAKLKCQVPGSLPQQMRQRKTVLNLKGTRRLTPTELYFWKIHMEPSFSGSRDSSHPKNKKQQESGRDLQAGQKLAKEWLASAPEEVRLKIEALALEDANQKKRMLEEGTPESIQRALQKIELMGFGNHESHQGSWADEICQRYQDKMASIHCSNDSDNIKWYICGASNRYIQDTSNQYIQTSNQYILDTSTGTFGTPPTGTSLMPPTSTFGTPPTSTSVMPPTIDMVNCTMVVVEVTNVPSDIWNLPNLNFNSLDPSYLQLNLSHVESLDLGLEPPLDVQQAVIDAALQWDAGQSMLDPVSEEEMLYLRSIWCPVIPEVVPEIPVQITPSGASKVLPDNYGAGSRTDTGRSSGPSARAMPR